MARLLPPLTVLAVVAFSGAVHGVWTNRWAGSDGLAQAAARLEQVPLTLGDWDGRPLEVNPREAALTEAAGYVHRQYVNRRTGSVVSVALLCGRAGPISVHTPEVCYAGAGF